MEEHASSTRGYTLTPQRLSSTLPSLFPFVFKENGGGHHWKRDVKAAGGIFIFVFVFSQGSPKYIEFLAHLSS